MKRSQGGGPIGLSDYIKEEIYKISKTILDNNCWIPYGYPSNSGYSTRTVIDKKDYLHRIVAHIFHGLDLNNQKQLACHNCHNNTCFNPEHIYVGSAKDNIQDSVKIKTQRNARKTTCPRGHTYNIINHAKKTRRCSICDNLKSARYRKARQLAKG